MKYIAITLILALSFTTLSLAQELATDTKKPENQSTENSPGKLEQELTKLFVEWLDARKRGDTEAMSRIMGEEWVLTNGGGQVITRATTLAAAKQGFFKNAVIETSGVSDSKINAYGDTVVWRFRKEKLRNLFVWVKRDGRWQWVAGAQTVIPEPSAK